VWLALDLAPPEVWQDPNFAPTEFSVTWSGYWADENLHRLENSPHLTDTADAVAWGKARAPAVFIRLADDHHLWAGDGDALRSDQTGLPRETFDPADPRATQEYGRMIVMESMRFFREGE